MGSTGTRRELSHYFERSGIGLEIVVGGPELEVFPFGEFLIERKALSREQLFEALLEQDRQPGIRLGEVVTLLGFVPADVVELLLGEFHDVDVVEID